MHDLQKSNAQLIVIRSRGYITYIPAFQDLYSLKLLSLMSEDSLADFSILEAIWKGWSIAFRHHQEGFIHHNKAKLPKYILTGATEMEGTIQWTK